jgi:hypothetical protein|tara:strand:+ start:702 stop:1055 length:354 start_codon:yes stop_codon:yes gene_type:complete
MTVDVYQSRTKFRNPQTTAREVIYSCPNNYLGELALVIFTNEDASTARVMKLEVYDADRAEYHTVFYESLPAIDSFIFDRGQYIMLDPGDQIVLTSTTANTISVTVTIKEVYVAQKT